MLIILVTWLLSSMGGGTLGPFVDDLDRLVAFADDHIEPKARRKEVLTLLDALDEVGVRHRERTEALRSDLLELAGNQTTTREAFEARIASSREQLRSDRAEALEVMFQVRQKMTREEWQRCFEDS